MEVRLIQTRWLAFIICLFSALASSSAAQTGTLRGRVTDPSAAVIPQAMITATTADGRSITVVTNGQGVYEFRGLAPGTYRVSASAKGFAVDQEEGVNIAPGQFEQLDIGLRIAVQEQHVEVQEGTPTVSVGAEGSAGTLILKGQDLDALSDDPDELQSELEALAGPSAGPNGGQIYIDGFTGGQLPPKSSIREIRINQNPFSAEYDHLGFGRIEVFTKPGTDKYHGQFLINGNTDSFNARNPFQGNGPLPGYDSQYYSANFGGPAGKKASFFLDFSRRKINELSVINTPALDANLNPIQFTDSF